jgi:hypothetical protein
MAGTIAKGLFLVLILAGEAAYAQCITNINGNTVCPPPEATCVKDRYGNAVCSPSKGSVTFDRYGDPVCGPGACVKDLRGEFNCSQSPGGSAAINLQSEAVCTDGCIRAAASYCTRPK